ncbi:hypothetical protein QUV96_07325 [Amedibacillus dolichus]|uniref:Uncharacterized protein n=1 Tax=Amedibacillus dolichus TaxID=31971 RepID=A0ABT7UCU9_9FIRM|nr:hypothetical protein [Amedibacillus dolichus]MDM8157444.1 hypothetical protein [Amedibacillus dolichus]
MARAIEERPVSIPQAIHQTPLTFSDEQIGIVAPIYGHEMPMMVRQFLREADFRCNYFYLILTYGNRQAVPENWPSSSVMTVASRWTISMCSAWWTTGCRPLTWTNSDRSTK